VDPLTQCSLSQPTTKVEFSWRSHLNKWASITPVLRPSQPVRLTMTTVRLTMTTVRLTMTTVRLTMTTNLRQCVTLFLGQSENLMLPMSNLRLWSSHRHPLFWPRRAGMFAFVRGRCVLLYSCSLLLPILSNIWTKAPACSLLLHHTNTTYCWQVPYAQEAGQAAADKARQKWKGAVTLLKACGTCVDASLE